MASLFSDILESKPAELEQGTQDSLEWFQANIRDIRRTPESLMKESNSFVSRFDLGKMYMYMYLPKTAGKLPYYDVFPLVLPLEPIPGGFMGMNFHYLPPLLRTRLLSRVQQYADNRKFDKGTKFDVSYDDLKNVNIVKPTIKKYLYSQVRTGFLRINADEAAIAIYLPVQRFKKASEARVYADSRRFI